MTINKPFFSIGVTTYKRPDLLRQCINSILSQSYSDFEILIGNDDPSTVITNENLGITDNRIKIHNHIENLGEVNNMNYLLSKAEGEFFTWLADDDLYEPQYLEYIFTIISGNCNIDCVYTKFRIIRGEKYPLPNKYSLNQPSFSDGSTFIHNYLKGKHQIISVYGMFRKTVLIDMGGVKNLSSAPIGLFGEYLLILSIPLNSKISYIDIPLVLYRAPEDGGGCWKNSYLSHYKIASTELIIVAACLFSQRQMKKQFIYNMSAIINLCLTCTLHKWLEDTERPKIIDVGSFILQIAVSIRKELSNKYCFLVGLLLIRQLIIYFVSLNISSGKNSNKLVLIIVKTFQFGLKGLLFFVYRPQVLFWDERDDDQIKE